MIHLYDKLYITYAETLVGPSAIDRLCDTYIHIVDKGLALYLNSSYPKNRFLYAKNITEALANYENEFDFFDAIKNKLDSSGVNKIIIYADESSLPEFLIRWWKGLFPNLKLDGLQALFYNYSDSEVVQLAKTTSYLNIASDHSEVGFKELSKLYWDKSAAELEGLFELYPGFKLPHYMKKLCSVEFQMCDFLINPDTNNLPYLIQKFSKYYKKAFVSEVCGIKRMIERNLMKVAEKDPEFGNKCFFGDSTLEDVLKNHSKLYFLRDDRIVEGKDIYNYLDLKYDLRKLCENLIYYDLLLNDLNIIDEKLVYLDNPCVGKFAKTGKHPDIIDLIKDEVEGSSRCKLFKRMVEKNLYNPYFVPSFRNLYRKNKESELIRQFSLGE